MFNPAQKSKETAIIRNFEQFDWNLPDLNVFTWTDMVAKIQNKIDEAANKGLFSTYFSVPEHFSNIKYNDSHNKYLILYFELLGYSCKEKFKSNESTLYFSW